MLFKISFNQNKSLIMVRILLECVSGLHIIFLLNPDTLKGFYFKFSSFLVVFENLGFGVRSYALSHLMALYITLVLLRKSKSMKHSTSICLFLVMKVHFRVTLT